jgi:hypothetical protein
MAKSRRQADERPSTDGDTGRGNDGRFRPGNSFGKGNPHAAEAAELREALLRGVTAGDITAIIKSLVKRARKGDILAAKEVLDRLVGRPMVHAEIADTTQREIELPSDYLRFLDWSADQEGKALP